MLVSFVVVSVIFSLSSGFVHAAGTISLSPTSGTIDGSGGAIDIVLDSAGGEIDGLEVSIEYSGDITFVDFDSGNINDCTVDGLERTTGEFEDIFLYCFILSAPYTGSDGVFATLNFEPTAEGTATVTIASVEAAGNVVIGDGEGSYTTTMATPDPAPDPAPESEDTSDHKTPLPDTSVMSTFGIMLGVALLCMPLVLNSRVPRKRGLMTRKVG